MTFDELVALCAEKGEPFSVLSRKLDGTYQASLRSGYDRANAFACDHGDTPTEALENVMRQRRILTTPAPKLAASDLF